MKFAKKSSHLREKPVFCRKIRIGYKIFVYAMRRPLVELFEYLQQENMGLLKNKNLQNSNQALSI
jgi:hypothetical protein